MNAPGVPTSVTGFAPLTGYSPSVEVTPGGVVCAVVSIVRWHVAVAGPLTMPSLVTTDQLTESPLLSFPPGMDTLVATDVLPEPGVRPPLDGSLTVPELLPADQRNVALSGCGWEEPLSSGSLMLALSVGVAVLT